MDELRYYEEKKRTGFSNEACILSLRSCKPLTAWVFRTTHTHIVSFVLVCASVCSCLWATAHSKIGPRRIHTLTGIKISNSMQ